MKPRLTAEDWQEIYYALSLKADLLRKGKYGPADSGHADADWIAQIERILETIGPDGERMVTR